MASRPFSCLVYAAWSPSNGEPFSITPRSSRAVCSVAIAVFRDVILLTGDSSIFPFTPETLLTSLAFRKPHCGACPGCPGFSTATKLARTLLNGLLFSEFSVSSGDRPRLGGDVDWSLEALFSNIARRFRTPEALFEDMTVEGTRVSVCFEESHTRVK